MESVASGTGVASDRVIDRSSAQPGVGSQAAARTAEQAALSADLESALTVDTFEGAVAPGRGCSEHGGGDVERAAGSGGGSADRVDTRAGSYRRRLENEGGRGDVEGAAAAIAAL